MTLLTFSHSRPPLGALPTRQLIHISHAPADLSLDEVRSLMFEARGFNLLNGIGGILAYDRRGFLHCIEGTGDAVDEVLDRVREDPRFGCIRVLEDIWREECEFTAFHDLIGSSTAPVSTEALARLWRVQLSPGTMQLLDEALAALARGPDRHCGCASWR